MRVYFWSLLLEHTMDHSPTCWGWAFLIRHSWGGVDSRCKCVIWELLTDKALHVTLTYPGQLVLPLQLSLSNSDHTLWSQKFLIVTHISFMMGMLLTSTGRVLIWIFFGWWWWTVIYSFSNYHLITFSMLQSAGFLLLFLYMFKNLSVG